MSQKPRNPPRPVIGFWTATWFHTVWMVAPAIILVVMVWIWGEFFGGPIVSFAGGWTLMGVVSVVLFPITQGTAYTLLQHRKHNVLTIRNMASMGFLAGLLATLFSILFAADIGFPAQVGISIVGGASMAVVGVLIWLFRHPLGLGAL